MFGDTTRCEPVSVVLGQQVRKNTVSDPTSIEKLVENVIEVTWAYEALVGLGYVVQAGETVDSRYVKQLIIQIAKDFVMPVESELTYEEEIYEFARMRLLEALPAEEEE